MSTGEAPEGKPTPRKLKRSEAPRPAFDVSRARAPTPTARLETMTGERILELVDDKSYYRRRCEALQAELDRLRPESARLREVVQSVKILDFVSLSLITLGGGLMTYAAFFTEPTNRVLAAVGFGVVLAGVVLALVFNVYRLTQ